MLKNLVLFLGAGIFLFSCGGDKDTVTSPSGIEVTFLKKGDAEAGPTDGDILMLNMKYDDANGNEMFKTDLSRSPVAMQYVDSIWKESGLIYEALKFMKKGDSVVFEIPAEDFFEKTFNADLPDTITRGSNLKFYIGMVDNMNRDQYVAYQREQYQKEQERIELLMTTKLIEDGMNIDKYLKENNISAKTTASGLRYIITEEGTGPTPQTGELVFVHYRGTLLDGTPFDASYDRGEPLQFPIGQGNVIQGWDEGIALLNKGAKATLYIPSPLAYGERAMGDVIAPFSILKFDVELVGINE